MARLSESCLEQLQAEGRAPSSLTPAELHNLAQLGLAEVETLSGTPTHPIWSEDRQAWVPLGDLLEGEQLRSHFNDFQPSPVHHSSLLTHHSSICLVLSRTLETCSLPVYNIEVHGHHVYQVGELGLLVHNMCAAVNKERGLWHLTIEGASRVLKHPVFGKFYQSKSDGLWWVIDKAGHGGSAFKVFKQTGKGLEWYRDADKFGDFILGKHKGPTGLFISWKELIG